MESKLKIPLFLQTVASLCELIATTRCPLKVLHGRPKKTSSEKVSWCCWILVALSYMGSRQLISKNLMMTAIECCDRSPRAHKRAHYAVLDRQHQQKKFAESLRFTFAPPGQSLCSIL
jgi:hypothetical protein